MVVARPGDISDVAIKPEMRVERHAERLQLGCDPQRAAGDIDRGDRGGRPELMASSEHNEGRMQDFISSHPPSLTLEVDPFNSAKGSGDACCSPSGSRWSPDAKRYLVHFGLRKAAGESNYMCIFTEKIP